MGFCCGVCCVGYDMLFGTNSIPTKEEDNYLNNIRFDSSLFTKFITENSKHDSAVAWEYFSSEAKGYCDKKRSMSERISTALWGTLGTLVRTIVDLFIRTFSLFNYKSNLTAKERGKQLLFCIGRDLGKLGGYIVIPFTDKGFHWVEHHKFQRELLLKGTSEKIAKDTLSKIATNLKHDTMGDLAKCCKKVGKLDYLVLTLVSTYVSYQLSDFNSKDAFGISFLTKDFDVEYWCTERRRFELLLSFLMHVEPKTLEQVSGITTALENKGENEKKTLIQSLVKKNEYYN